MRRDPDNTRALSSRRHFLAGQALGLAGLAAAWLDQRTGVAAEQSGPDKPSLVPPTYDLAPKPTHHRPRAKAMISLWMQGGPSHLDLFDPKPELQRFDGKNFPGQIKYDNAAQASSKVLGSPWKFHPRGESGMEISELLPHLAKVVDEITLIRSMRTSVNNHGQSIRALTSGNIRAGRPSLGSWLTYGLGAETDQLPAYLALIDPGQLPVLGVENWSQGFLPSIYQGTVVRPQEPRILNLDAPPQLAGGPQQRWLGYLQGLNQRHQQEHLEETDLDARIASYALAARMQVAALEALDLSQETQETKNLYGMNQPETAEYGARCLIARRLVERGVRFVQVFTQNQYWDHHNGILKSLPRSCQKVDQPSAALVLDLKRRGLLDETVVHWGGEMGRLPVVQNDAGKDKAGRDHNTHGFSMWVAGGGFRRGCAFGNTDDFGHKAVENVVNHYDYHATLLHLFGLEHEALSFKQGAQEQSLIDKQPARIVHEILA